MTYIVIPFSNQLLKSMQFLPILRSLRKTGFANGSDGSGFTGKVVHTIFLHLWFILFSFLINVESIHKAFLEYPDHHWQYF